VRVKKREDSGLAKGWGNQGVGGGGDHHGQRGPHTRNPFQLKKKTEVTTWIVSSESELGGKRQGGVGTYVTISLYRGGKGKGGEL